MHLLLNKSLSLQGNVIVPGSKSQSIRGMLLALLASGESTLVNVLNSEDTEAAMRVCTALGAKLNLAHKTLTINSDGLPFTETAAEIHTGNSGITTHFILPLLGLRKNYMTPIRLHCDKQMQARPIKSLMNALENLGMRIQYIEQENKLPIVVTGQLKGGVTEIDGITSQYLSALLIALPCAEKDSVIIVKDLHERPYVNMTLDWLQQQKIDYTHQQISDVDTFHICGNQRYASIHTAIKGDFSSASCLLAAAVLLPGQVALQGLDNEDIQGDKQLITILQKMGADIVTEKNKIHIKGNKKLTGLRIDANDIPDLVPALAVIATQAFGKTEIYNVKQARVKETDRIHSMTEGLKKMGASIEEYADGMTIYQSKLQGALVKGYGDHRTVMALSVAGMLAHGTTMITDGEAITKTYPGFIDAMQSIGAKINFYEPITNHHIILIGFKHTGKTIIGRQLAKILNKKFIDLDREIEKLYEQRYFELFTCRQIMQLRGETYYRELETDVLTEVLKLPPCVISLGGGTSLSQINQDMIKSHLLLHVIASRGIVFERIMVEGRPAFFNPDEDPYESFGRLWKERNATYKKLTARTINNNDTVERAVVDALIHLKHPSGENNYA